MPDEVKEVKDDQVVETTQADTSDDELSKVFDAATSPPTSEVATEATKKEEAAAGEEAVKEGEEGTKEGEIAEAVTEVTEGTEAKKKADPDHPTNLGRKVKRLEDNVSELLKQNSELLTALKERLAPPPQAAAPEGQDDPDIITTSDDLERYLAKRETKLRETHRTAEITYMTGYKKRLDGWMSNAEEAGDKDAAEIHKLLTDDKSPFNVRRSLNPDADFELNLAKAESHLYKQQASGVTKDKENPLDKNRDAKPKSPLGVAGQSKSDTGKSVPDFKLSHEALELLKGTGITEDEARKYLQAQGYIGGR